MATSSSFFASVFVPIKHPYSPEKKNMRLSMRGYHVFSNPKYNWIWIPEDDDAIHFDSETLSITSLKTLAGADAILL